MMLPQQLQRFGKQLHLLYWSTEIKSNRRWAGLVERLGRRYNKDGKNDRKLSIVLENP